MMKCSEADGTSRIMNETFGGWLVSAFVRELSKDGINW